MNIVGIGTKVNSCGGCYMKAGSSRITLDDLNREPVVHTWSYKITVPA